MDAVTMPHAKSFLRLDLVRLARDVSSVAALAAILGVPVIGALYGVSALPLHMTMSLFLPVLAGWSWGGDLAAGTLAPLAYSAIAPSSLLATRCAAFALQLVFAIHVLLLGFLLSTLSRSAEVGWLPIFIAFAGVWLPIVLIMKRSGGEIPQRGLRALAVLFAPSIATSLSFASIKGAMLVHLAAALLWAALSIRAIGRPGAIR